jgi:hypothetical protein
MSIEVLYSAQNGAIKQKPCHDLESIFYVILYICTFYDGPGLEGKREVADTMPINTWFGGDMAFPEMGDLKYGQVAHFEDRFLDNIQPYFRDLIPCLCTIVDTLFPPTSDGIRNPGKCTGTHEKVTEALQAAYDSLLDSDVPEPDSDLSEPDTNHPTSRAPTGSSRKLRSATKRRSEEMLQVNQSTGPISSGSKRTRCS